MALAVALLLALGSVGYALLHLQQLLTERVSDWLQTQSLAAPSLWPAFSGYAAALLFVHVLLAFAAWGLAVVSKRAFHGITWNLRRWALNWGCVLCLWVLIANAALFPQSIFASALGLGLLDTGVIKSMFWLFSSVLGGVATIALLVLLAPHAKARKLALRCVVYAVLAIGAVQVVTWTREYSLANADVPSGGPPNVIVIGIDSLRTDVVGGESGALGFTPAIDRFLRDAVLFHDTVTPLGRTFPAWVSILSGQSPVSTGVRDNLVPRSQIKMHGSVAEYFRKAGYRTVYATDEVRFSYIDSSYGFDQVVSPPMGATDFMIGSFNDLPLANLIVNTWLGRWLFPNTHANRAAWTTYRPDTFVHWLDDEVWFDGPVLLATHLTLPHWPYSWADAANATFSSTQNNRYAYASSLIAVDRQFGMLVKMLERKGALRNAIVVVLSDHGEGVGLPGDNMIYSRTAKQAVGPLAVEMHGHGNSVLSPNQFQVVLAMRRYGAAAFTAKSPVHVPACLEDITPTLLGLAGIDASNGRFDGISWARLLTNGDAGESGHADRIRFTETGLVVGFAPTGAVDAGDLADRNIRKYEMEPRTGRLVLRTDALQHIVKIKERAAFSQQHLLAAVPAVDGKKMRYILVDKQTGAARALDEAPDVDDTIAHRLWTALHAHFAGELSEPIAQAPPST